MNEINFNCPHCDESLAVDASSAGATVACPKCGQTILVPEMARLAQTPSPSRAWWVVALGVVVLSFFAVGLVVSKKHGHAGTPALIVVTGISESMESNLVLYFNFQSEPQAGKVVDLSGHGNDGQAVNVEWVADGHRGGCAEFGLTNSYIRVPDNESLNPPKFTLAAWIKTSSTDRNWRRIFDKAWHDEFDLTMGGDDAVGGPDDGRSWRGQVALEVAHQWLPSGIQIADGRWHLVVGTFDAAELRIYVDGQPAGNPRRAKGQPQHVAYDLTIGANRSTGSSQEIGVSFNGLMDDVMMFNRALSPEEVGALYNTQKTASDAGIEPAASSS